MGIRIQRKGLLAAVIAAGMIGLSAQAAVVTVTQDFNTPGQLNNFTQFIQQNSTNNTGGIAESSNGGVSDSGSLSVPGTVATTDETLTYNQPFDFSQAGQTITQSSIFKMGSTLTGMASGTKPIQLGFLTVLGSGFNGNTNQNTGVTPAFTSIRINTTAAGTAGSIAAQLQVQDKTAAGGTSTVNGSNITLNANEYYQLSLVETQNGSTYSIDGSLQDMGTDGATPTGAPITINGDLRTDADLATSVYAGIRDSGNNGVANYDNFVVTATPAPEPVSLGLFALGGLGLLARRRRA